MAHLSADSETIRRNLEGITRDVDEAALRSGRSVGSVSICVATKYVDSAGMAALRDAGVGIAAENRLQDMIQKQESFKDDFKWHFIGAIQSRKVLEIAPRVSSIQSLATESARDKLAGLSGSLPRVLVQVNVSGEASKQGIAPGELAAFIADCPVAVSGLMTMPPLATDPDDTRRHFAALRELATEHGLDELSMGTSQDYICAVEEGATMIRVGSVLFDHSNQ